MKFGSLIWGLVLAGQAFGQSAAKSVSSLAELVPAGYVLVESFQGDLNKDQQPDQVLLIKATDRKQWVNDPYLGELDRNRRGLIIALGQQGRYQPVLTNLSCFSSENEDGGVYFAPELAVSIDKGSLKIHYLHGRYGDWAYRFRYQNAEFELIGYDRSQDNGLDQQSSVSINFITKKIRTLAPAEVDAGAAGNRMIERWQNFELAQPIRLKQVADFDQLYPEQLVGLKR